jgi:hypothetical protein
MIHEKHNFILQRTAMNDEKNLAFLRKFSSLVYRTFGFFLFSCIIYRGSVISRYTTIVVAHY